MMYKWTDFEQKLIIHRDTSIDISRILLDLFHKSKNNQYFGQYFRSNFLSIRA
jgi:hypothetical protein